jgi:uncharacterized lipoprotein
MTARRIVSAVAVLLVLTLAACSDDDGLTGKQKQDISNFRAGANSICATATTAGHAAVAQGLAQYPGGVASVSDAHSYLVTTVIPIFEKELGDLHNLGEPTLDRASWDDMRAQLDTSLTDLKSAADTDPVKTLQAVLTAPQSGTGTSAIDKAAVSFGIEECAKN